MQGIPLIMSGRDVIIHSETGSGKTLTYVLPLLKLLQQIPVSTPETGPVALIIAPTRELADQIHTTIAHFTLSPLVPEFMVRSLRDNDADLVRFIAFSFTSLSSPQTGDCGIAFSGRGEATVCRSSTWS